MSGSWLMYCVYRNGAKEEMKCFIQSNPHCFNVVEFKITTLNINDFEIQDNGSEVAYNNVLYDIIARKENGSAIVLSCLKDLNETSVIDTYNDYLEKQHKQSSNSKSSDQRRFSNQLYDDIRFTVSLNHPFSLIFCSQLSFKEVRCNDFFAEVITPPPQLNTVD